MSDLTSSGEEDFISHSICNNFSPVKSKTHVNSTSQDGRNDFTAEHNPETVIKSLIPNVDDNDYHDFEQSVPVLIKNKKYFKCTTAIHTYDR